ncbi:hypothetical protein NUW58_g7654 [Xylaria curta]|uniref:Uncharacterized protein n=1 Tax=Xylaria curta TaxID=42375 RepID=A0ACC1NGA3_9PEZI|nr:hypothetical protein NUW58_g7654 [Xylaria curta]
MYNKWPSFWEFFRNFEYVFWPIETDRGYFVTAIFHMEKGMMDDPNVDPDEDLEADIPQVPDPRFGIVDAWSVIDPERGQAAQDRINQVKDRIQRIFTAEGIVFKVQSYKDQEVVGGVRRSCPWVPPPPNPEESWSSGVRSFDLIRQLMQRVLNMYCNQRGYSEAFFTEPTCGWINVDQVRYEMMSMCAINTLDDMNWNARLAVEGIREITTLDPEFRTTLLAPNDADKHAYVPASDIAGPITVLP